MKKWRLQKGFMTIVNGQKKFITAKMQHRMPGSMLDSLRANRKEAIKNKLLK